jgi:hypothetical protein
MILSEKWKFIFIKGRKVAGTSVEIALSTIVGPNDIVTPITPIDEIERLRRGGRPQNFSDAPSTVAEYISRISSATIAQLPRVKLPQGRYSNHMSLRSVIENYGPATGFLIFCVERSPYSKILSLAKMAFTLGQYMREQSMIVFLYEIIESGAVLNARNIDLYRDHQCQIAIHAIRYQELRTEFETLLRRLGVANPPELPHVKKGILADRLNPKDFFTPHQIARINDLFIEEFATFGYAPL